MAAITKVFKNRFSSGYTNIFDVNGQKFRIIIEGFESVGSYAPVIIEDMETRNRYYSNGRIDIRGIIFETRWEEEYNRRLDNYFTTHDLIVNITY